MPAACRGDTDTENALKSICQQDARKALGLLQSAARDKPVLLVLNQQEITNSDYTARYGSYYLEPEG